jgi:hypothetical protein
VREQPQALFAGSDLGNHASSVIQRAILPLANATPLTLRSESLEDLTERLYNENRIVLPYLHLDRIQHESFEGIFKIFATAKTVERTFNNMGDTLKGIVFAIEVPFGGDHRYFSISPSGKRTEQVLGHVGEQALTLYVAAPNLEPEQVQYRFDQMLAAIESCLQQQVERLRNFPTQFQQAVHNAVNSRLAMFDRGSAVSSALRFPLKSRRDAPELTVPLKRTVIAPAQSPKAELPPLARAMLAEEHYESILKVMENMARAMEFSPTAFATLGEEALRFHFLVFLNGLYEGAATGETFNYTGKTDILIRDRNVNLFVAECKIWSGPGAFADAVDQLQRYVSWRDTKTAIVVFNRNKVFSAVIDAAVRVMNDHPQRRSGPVRITETRFRYTFSQLGDPAREYSLTLMLFDVPRPD